MGLRDVVAVLGRRPAYRPRIQTGALRKGITRRPAHSDVQPGVRFCARFSSTSIDLGEIEVEGPAAFAISKEANMADQSKKAVVAVLNECAGLVTNDRQATPRQIRFLASLIVERDESVDKFKGQPLTLKNASAAIESRLNKQPATA
jgi:hypothetical protein